MYLSLIYLSIHLIFIYLLSGYRPPAAGHMWQQWNNGQPAADNQPAAAETAGGVQDMLGLMGAHSQEIILDI